MSATGLWVAFGLIGQALFSGRFLVQWIASERARRSVVPSAFWFFSVAGGVVLLIYAIYKRDPVLTLVVRRNDNSVHARVIACIGCRLELR